MDVGQYVAAFGIDGNVHIGSWAAPATSQIKPRMSPRMSVASSWSPNVGEYAPENPRSMTTTQALCRFPYRMLQGPEAGVHGCCMGPAKACPHAAEGFTMQRRTNPQHGFTLLELLVVLVVLGLLAGIVAPKYFSQLGRSEAKVAQAQIEGLSKATGPVPHGSRPLPQQ